MIKVLSNLFKYLKTRDSKFWINISIILVLMITTEIGTLIFIFIFILLPVVGSMYLLSISITHLFLSFYCYIKYKENILGLRTIINALTSIIILISYFFWLIYPGCWISFFDNKSCDSIEIRMIGLVKGMFFLSVILSFIMFFSKLNELKLIRRINSIEKKFKSNLSELDKEIEDTKRNL